MVAVPDAVALSAEDRRQIRPFRYVGAGSSPSATVLSVWFPENPESLGAIFSGNPAA